jgi:hypothetical protein
MHTVQTRRSKQTAMVTTAKPETPTVQPPALQFQVDPTKIAGDIDAFLGPQLRFAAAEAALASLVAQSSKGLVFVVSNEPALREWAQGAEEEASVVWVADAQTDPGATGKRPGATLRLFSNGDQLVARQDVVLQLLRFIAQRKNTTVTAVLLTDLQSPPAFEVAPGVLTIAPFKDVLHHMVQQLPHDDGGGPADAARVAHVTHWLERVPRTAVAPRQRTRFIHRAALRIRSRCRPARCHDDVERGLTWLVCRLP